MGETRAGAGVGRRGTLVGTTARHRQATGAEPGTGARDRGRAGPAARAGRRRRGTLGGAPAPNRQATGAEPGTGARDRGLSGPAARRLMRGAFDRANGSMGPTTAPSD